MRDWLIIKKNYNKFQNCQENCAMPFAWGVLLFPWRDKVEAGRWIAIYIIVRVGETGI
jgi:hypothetical protein